MSRKKMQKELFEVERELLKVKKRQRGFTEVERVADFLLLLAGGGEHLEDFQVLGEDDGLFLLLGRKTLSPDTARTVLQFFHDEELIGKARKAAKDAGERSYVPEENDPLCENALRGHIGFTISADMTKQLQACWRAVLDERAVTEPDAPFWRMPDDTRPNETAWWSEVEFTPGVWPQTAEPLRYFVIRFLKRQGGLFATGEPCKYLAIVTNRKGQCDQLIRWYWQKAGSIEHFHDSMAWH